MCAAKTKTSVAARQTRQHLMYTRTMTVGIVTRVLANGWVEVQPQIQLVHRNEDQEETPVSLGKLTRVPIGYYKAGGFIMTLPTAIGDEGIIIFSDRALDVWKKTGKLNPPRDARFHDISDGVFLPFPTSEVRQLNPFTPDAMVMGKEDGTAKITIGTNGEVVIDSDVSITTNSPVAVVNAFDVATINTKAATVNASDSTTVNTDVCSVVANTSVDITTATATITASASVGIMSPMTNISGALIVQGATTLVGGFAVPAGGGGGGAGGSISGSLVVTDGTVKADDLETTSGYKALTHEHPNGGLGNPTGAPTI